MKKLFALSAIAAAFVGTSVQAGDLATVYGKLNVTVQNTDVDGSDSVFDVRSNASRFGIKGEADLGSGLSAIYKLEWQVDIADDSTNDGDDENLKSRNQYVGLKGGFGQILFGRHDTPLKASQGKIDLFGDLDGDIKTIMEGENRENDVIYYATPSFAGGLTGHLAIMPGELKDDEGKNDGLADHVSGAIIYDANGIYGAFAVDSDVAGYDTVRATGAYSTDNFQVGLLFQNAEEADVDNAIEEQSIVLSGYYKIDALKLKAQYGTTDYDKTDVETDMISVGVEYALGKKTMVQTFYTTLEVDTGAGSVDADTFGFGLEHKF